MFETHDEYFDYYRNYHAFWKLYGMGLPDVVLKKLYYQNALKITPGMPQTWLVVRRQGPRLPAHDRRRDELWVDIARGDSSCRTFLIVSQSQRPRQSSQESSMNRTSSLAAAAFLVATLGVASQAAAQRIKLESDGHLQSARKQTGHRRARHRK